MSAASSWNDRLLRIGSDTVRDRWLDCLWLLGACCLLIATGIGLRDPWPADEPRFALIARDMLAIGEWLVPRIAGDIYADKPPLFFWLIAAFLKMTGSLRIAFLMPSLLSAVSCVLLVYDLAKRLWRREVGLTAAATLLFTVQFVWQARQAQIDATLCFWTTLSLYGLLRHLILGPRWGWYAVGWAAAGFGVITKGVGFLPLLVLIPFAVLRSLKWEPRICVHQPLRWALGPLAFLLAVGMWLVPMLIAASGDGVLATYRDEILFRQTMDRYANAWHHREPFWYFIVNVIPALWLPLTLLVPWLVPKWREALRQHDLTITLLLTWAALVVAFFSLSAGKRGVYVLPALPALALASAPHLLELYQRKSVQRAMWVLALTIGVICASTAIVLFIDSARRHEVITNYGFDPLAPMTLVATVVLIVSSLARPKRGVVAFCGTLASILVIVSFWVNPAMNAPRSGAEFVQRIETVADPSRELGLVAFKEQYLLNLRRRPVVHFGHARWREAEQEAFDAARWLNDNPQRQLVIDANVKERCFANTHARSLGSANRLQWFLVEGQAEVSCASGGNANVAQAYAPPNRGHLHSDGDASPSRRTRRSAGSRVRGSAANG
jgi:4-amino-4-deoxy-L-arabinose transferase-like glycosyltransferase